MKWSQRTIKRFLESFPQEITEARGGYHEENKIEVGDNTAFVNLS